MTCRIVSSRPKVESGWLSALWSGALISRDQPGGANQLAKHWFITSFFEGPCPAARRAFDIPYFFWRIYFINTRPYSFFMPPDCRESFFILWENGFVRKKAVCCVDSALARIFILQLCVGETRRRWNTGNNWRQKRRATEGRFRTYNRRSAGHDKNRYSVDYKCYNNKEMVIRSRFYFRGQSSTPLIARNSQESEDVLEQESSENDVFSRLSSALSAHDLPQICHAIGKVNHLFTQL